jgi:hypothetical protein
MALIGVSASPPGTSHTAIFAAYACRIDQPARNRTASILNYGRLDRAYSVFVRELHRRISNAAPLIRFEQGYSPLLYWPSLVAFVAIALGLAALVVRALQADAYGGAAFICAFLALYLWHSTNFLRRNRPGVYGHDALPKDLMPKP